MFALLFVIMALGYLIGGIEIKGVSLGTAGVFLVAILFGWLCTLDFGSVPLLNAFHVNSVDDALVKNLKGPIQNIGLILFVGSVGFIAGPRFFKDLAKNFKTYIVIGVIVIISGTAVAVVCTLLTPDYGPEYWAGILSGALTSTPGFSAAQDAATENVARITLGHAIAYPFGVIGVVLFVQLMPKFLKSDMNHERSLLKIGADEEKKDFSKFFMPDQLGFTAFGLAIVAGLLLGAIKIPLTGAGYGGPCFSLGTTGGVLIMTLVFGHFGHIGKLSLQVPHETLKALKEFGLALFLLGAGFEGGVSLVGEISAQSDPGAFVAWGFVGGALMTLVPMVVGFFMAKYLMKLPLLNNLGSITGGMTSTPALGTLCKTAGTDDVAGAYASTYPIALVLIVLACQLMITLM
ncbi:MAG: hypothetical protein E7353_02735 [Clostridiales bacterium]|nr:hypothetical protein [Clostridiales bacterium]